MLKTSPSSKPKLTSMKSFLCFLLITFNTLFLFSQTFDIETIKNAGNNDIRINLVILSEGYQTSEFAKFKTDAESLVTDMFTQSPFLEYADYFNVHIIKVPSNESGADHPGTAIDVTEPYNIPITAVDTYFNATFDAFGYHRFLYYGIDYADAASAELKIRSVLADNFPTYDQALLIVNSSEYGGTGGEFPVTSTHTSANQIAIHELGHSMFDLKDEYLVPDVFYGEAINMTQETNTSLVKWGNWLNDNGVNIYPYGTSGVPATWYRPHQSCKMRYLGFPFCSVCKEGIIEKIHSLISPIDSYTPNNTVDNPTFPLDFQLDLVKPDPNTLERAWTLNTVSFASDVDAISILETDLVDGANTLTTVIHDNSNFLRVDNHDSFHVYTVTWTINYTSLGIDDIESEVNNYNISLYPNPSNTIVNLKFESNTISDLKVKIMSIDGKKIKSTTLSNYENAQVDISNLSQGIYVTNFYSGNVLIASKRLVKK